jgi:hypothetical protein
MSEDQRPFEREAATHSNRVKGGRRSRLWKWFRSIHYGEVALWIMFLAAGLTGAADNREEALVFAGLCALSAIGLRATRPDPVQHPQ